VSIDLEGARCDEEAARLLPWYLVGRLPPADVDRVERHVEHCAICRADLSHEREVRALLKADARVEYAPQAGLAKTLTRIDELGRDAPVAAMRPLAAAARRGHAVQWLTAAVIVQTIGLGVLGGAFANRKAAEVARPEYTTLSAGGAQLAGAGHVRAVFAPGLTLAELSGVLAARQLTVVGGPSDAGVYTLASTAPKPAASLEATVAALRSDARVLFVERAVNDETAKR
jgi:anti-sigma factor RsiW